MANEIRKISTRCCTGHDMPRIQLVTDAPQCKNTRSTDVLCPAADYDAVMKRCLSEKYSR